MASADRGFDVTMTGLNVSKIVWIEAAPEDGR